MNVNYLNHFDPQNTIGIRLLLVSNYEQPVSEKHVSSVVAKLSTEMNENYEYTNFHPSFSIELDN